MQYYLGDIKFGKKNLTEDYRADIVIWHKLGDKKAFRELFRLKQELNQYTFRMQFFILQYLIEEYIQRNMIDAAEKELDYLYLITGIQYIALENDYRILNDLKVKIENSNRGVKDMYLKLLEYLEMNDCGVVLTRNGKALEILDGDEVLEKVKDKVLKVLKYDSIKDCFSCIFNDKTVVLKAL